MLLDHRARDVAYSAMNLAYAVRERDANEVCRVALKLPGSNPKLSRTVANGLLKLGCAWTLFGS